MAARIKGTIPTFIAADPHRTGTRSPWAIRSLEPQQDLVLAQGLFLKVLFHQLVFAFGRGLDQDHARFLDLVGHVVGNGHLGPLFAGIGLFGQEVHHTLKIGLAADGQLDRHRYNVKLGADLGHDTAIVDVFALHLVHKGQAGQVPLAGIMPHLLGSHLNPARGVEHDHRAFDNAGGAHQLRPQSPYTRACRARSACGLPTRRASAKC